MQPFYVPIKQFEFLTDELQDAASLPQLFLCFSGEEACANDEWDFGETALAEDFGVTEREEVEDRSSV